MTIIINTIIGQIHFFHSACWLQKETNISACSFILWFGSMQPTEQQTWWQSNPLITSVVYSSPHHFSETVLITKLITSAKYSSTHHLVKHCSSSTSSVKWSMAHHPAHYLNMAIIHIITPVKHHSSSRLSFNFKWSIAHHPAHHLSITHFTR